MSTETNEHERVVVVNIPRVVNVYKAQSTQGRDLVPTTSIVIGGASSASSSSGEFPRIDDFDQSDAVRDADARAIVTALRESLPGSVLDRVAGLLALATASRLTIPILDAPYLATVAPAVRRGLGHAQRMLSSMVVERGGAERTEARAAVAWLEDQLWGGRISGLIVEEDEEDEEDAVAPAMHALVDHQPRLTASSPPRIIGCSCSWVMPEGVADSEDAWSDHVAAARVSDDSPSGLPSFRTGFMTWRDLAGRLRELAPALEGPAGAQEVVVRIEDDEVSACGGLQSADVETGCTEEPALVLDASSVSICEDVTRFADGALSEPRAATFRRHLRSCARCMVELARALQLSAQLSCADVPRRAKLLEAGIASVDCALLETFAREYRSSNEPDLVLRATSVAAALAALSGGPHISVEVAGILILLRRRWMAQTEPSPFLTSLCVLMSSLGLDAGDWTGRHCPAVTDSEDAPGVKIAGCSCGWRVPEGVSVPVEAFDLHAGEAFGDEAAVSEAFEPEDAAVLMMRLLRGLPGVTVGESARFDERDVAAFLGRSDHLSVALLSLIREPVSERDRSELDVVRIRLSNMLPASCVGDQEG